MWFIICYETVLRLVGALDATLIIVENRITDIIVHFKLIALIHRSQTMLSQWLYFGVYYIMGVSKRSIGSVLSW